MTPVVLVIALLGACFALVQLWDWLARREHAPQSRETPAQRAPWWKRRLS